MLITYGGPLSFVQCYIRTLWRIIRRSVVGPCDAGASTVSTDVDTWSSRGKIWGRKIWS